MTSKETIEKIIIRKCTAMDIIKLIEDLPRIYPYLNEETAYIICEEIAEKYGIELGEKDYDK